MTTLATARPTIQRPEPAFLVDDAQPAAAAFLARYSGRTLDAYRHDLRGFFQWAVDHSIPVLETTRPHIELFRSWMDDRGLAASTIDRRLSTVCGFYRFAHIDGRIGSNPAQYVRRPQVHPSNARGLDRSELGVFLFTADHYDHEPRIRAIHGHKGIDQSRGTNLLGIGRGTRGERARPWKGCLGAG
jgi:integrase/recombinase XerD